MHQLRQGLAAAALGVLALVPLGVCAETAAPTQTRTTVYSAELVPEYGAGAYDGQLTLTVESNGIISGTYRPADGSPRSISGGTDSDGIWLDLGLEDHTIIYASKVNGALEGTAWIGTDRYSFEAKPIAH